MRIALLSDIHGNLIALDAVLADIRSIGADQIWVGGDFSAIGPEPVAVLDRIAALDDAVFIRGNTDRYIVTGETPPPTVAEVEARPELIPLHARIAASFAWTRGCVTERGWFEWLERLPLEVRLTLPGGVRMLVVHAAPGTDDGEGVHPGRSNAELATLFAGSNADVVFVGHTHEPMVRRIGDVLVVNLGSVSNPRSPDLRASYALLEVAPSRIDVLLRRVAYDHDAFTASVLRSRHPAAEFIISHQRGERCGHEPHDDHTDVGPDARIAVHTVRG